MLIYLIEDDGQKIEGIVSFIRETRPNMKVLVHQSYQSGLKALQRQIPKLLILDMTLPTFDLSPITRPGRPRPIGGYEIMRKMKRSRATCPVLVMTQLEKFGEGEGQVSFDEMNARCLAEFPEMFWGAVYYHPTSTTWQEKLGQILGRLDDCGIQS